MPSRLVAATRKNACLATTRCKTAAAAGCSPRSRLESRAGLEPPKKVGAQDPVISLPGQAAWRRLLAVAQTGHTGSTRSLLIECGGGCRDRRDGGSKALNVINCELVPTWT